MYKKLIIITALLATLSACSNAQPELKSPCVGAEGSPCDRRSPAGNHA